MSPAKAAIGSARASIDLPKPIGFLSINSRRHTSSSQKKQIKEILDQPEQIKELKIEVQKSIDETEIG